MNETEPQHISGQELNPNTVYRLDFGNICFDIYGVLPLSVQIRTIALATGLSYAEVKQIAINQHPDLADKLTDL